MEKGTKTTSLTEELGTRLAYKGGESVSEWKDRVKMAHESALGRVLPHYQIIETLQKERKSVMTFIYGGSLGIGVLTTNFTGESFMYFVEQTRTPMKFLTCSSFQNRFSLTLAIREAYRITRLALQRGLFKRCFKTQYMRGQGEIRRLAD